jgi:phosphatidylglycerol:prolipoprotein diacylglycerol transferase
MRRVLFRIRGIPIHSYPAMLYAGLVAGMIAGNYLAHSTGLDRFRVFVASIILTIPAIGGARVLHVIQRWSYYRDHKSLIWDLQQGGMAQYGGILLAVPLSVPLLSALGLPFGLFWDLGGVTILTGMVFTRIGCLLNGCCSGRETESRFSLWLPNRKGEWKQRFPTQLLEAGWALLLVSTTFLMWGRLPFEGASFVFDAGGYAVGRLAFESLRDLGQSRSRFTLHHAISLLIIGLSLAAITGRAFM